METRERGRMEGKKKRRGKERKKEGGGKVRLERRQRGRK